MYVSAACNPPVNLYLRNLVHLPPLRRTSDARAVKYDPSEVTTCVPSDAYVLNPTERSVLTLLHIKTIPKRLSYISSFVSAAGDGVSQTLTQG